MTYINLRWPNTHNVHLNIYFSSTKEGLHIVTRLALNSCIIPGDPLLVHGMHQYRGICSYCEGWMKVRYMEWGLRRKAWLSNSVHTARPPQPCNVYDDENEVSIAANGEHIQIVCCLILQHCRCVWKVTDSDWGISGWIVLTHNYWSTRVCSMCLSWMRALYL